MLNIGQIDPFSPLWKCSLYIWTQVIIQTTGIVSPHQPHLLEVWMEIFMSFHGLETILWPLRAYEHATTPNIPYMEENGHLKGQDLSVDSVWRSGWACHTPLISIYGRKWTLGRSRLVTWHSLPVYPIPSVWSQIWKWKHLKSVLNFLVMYIV